MKKRTNNRSEPRAMPPRRGWTLAQVARRLGVSEATFHKISKTLYAAGLPKPDDITRRTDRRAVDAWMDRRSGVAGGTQSGPSLERVEAAERKPAKARGRPR